MVDSRVMAKVLAAFLRDWTPWGYWHDKFVAPEGSTLAGAARTDDPPVVPMSGGQEPAGAAKPSTANGRAG